MKITHYICPRGCGKTTKAQELQMGDPENTLLIELRTNTNFNIIIEKLRGQRLNRLIIDELLLVSNRVGYINFCELLIQRIPKELILFSTPDKLYDKLAFKLLTVESDLFFKSMGIAEIMKEREKEFDYKFLNPRRVNIVKTCFEGNLFIHDEEYYKNNMMEEEFLTQIKGEFLK